ncbi:Ribosomal RNA-processing protein 14 N-terminal [Arabidopsis suecica]|uniref:Ribosomal RNA-processing protein 14 N-terminal n=1 Tax=Arabidopsis suecica TaxID=45249 RepID=A0A8T2AIF1_ARASU|nr:Ribosomal RNA-processing protein 14 N-terminal [Arabidopsis suecica]
MTKKKVKLDLESDNIVDMIHRHADFSDKLINLVPARIYLSDDDKEKKWFQGLRKEEKVNAKREKIENLKKAKRYRLDPEKSVLTTLDLQKQKLEKEKEKFGIKLMFLGLQEDDTFEKMRERRLQKNKRKRDSCLNVVEEVVKDLTYGYIKIGDDDEEGLKKDPKKGDFVAKKHSWKAAISRAAGIKIRDDPKRLKQRIRKEKNRREKNAEKWKERVEVQQKVRVEKQQKRSENITNRIQ